jgi:hypothetical protein
MPFIGNQPALSYTSFAKQDFTTSATTSYTLDNPVTNENELALFINFVRQEPTTAYTASGTTLTLTSATSASDDMYCVFLGKAIQTVNPPSGSVGLSQLSATGTKDSTTFLRGDNTFQTIGTNTPAFHVNLSSNQSVSDNVATKIEFDREVFDTNSVYDNSTNYRFTVPSGQAGKYHFYFNILTASTVLSGADQVSGSFYLNGSNRGIFYGADARSNPGTKFTSHGIITFDLSVGDYVEVYGVVNYNSGTGNISSGGTSRPDESCFGGYKIIE